VLINLEISTFSFFHAHPCLVVLQCSVFRYISTIAFRSTSPSDITTRPKRWNKMSSFRVGSHFARYFTPTCGAKTAESNFLESGSDNNVRRGTLPVSGVYLNNFPYIQHRVRLVNKVLFFFLLLYILGPFTVGLTVSDRKIVQYLFRHSLHFHRENKLANTTRQLTLHR